MRNEYAVTAAVLDELPAPFDLPELPRRARRSECRSEKSHWREAMRLVNLRIFTLLGALALLFSIGLLTQPGSAAAAGPSGAQVGRTTVSADTSSGGACALYDSWCAFCTRAPDAAACQAIVPAHESGTTVEGAKNTAGNKFIPGVNIGIGMPGTPPENVFTSATAVGP